MAIAILSLGFYIGGAYLKATKIDDLVWQNIFEQWPERLAQFFYFVGLPYLILILGGFTLNHIGLQGLEFFNLIDWGGDALSVQLQQALTLMLLTWLLDIKITILMSLLCLAFLSGVWLTLRSQGLSGPTIYEPSWFTILYAGHWAFYRALFWAATDDLYLGTVLGCALVMVEWILGFIGSKQGPIQNYFEQQQFFSRAMILVLTSTIFFYTANLWLLIPIQLLMVAIINKRWGTKQQWQTL